MVDSLNDIRVAAPCKASWDGMHGDDRVRFCSQCRQNVYNLSEMSRAEATNLIQNHEGRTCVRFYRRNDGTLLTRDCPTGLRALRRRTMIGVTAIGVLVATVLLACFGMALSSTPKRNAIVGDDEPRLGAFERVWAILFPPPPDECVMGRPAFR
ncbi:MAG: MnhB domain-containing protein [Planctomycetes bacterium]|nr:MnhB domain-containing protein [Planctomycetota bacterium]